MNQGQNYSAEEAQSARARLYTARTEANRAIVSNDRRITFAGFLSGDDEQPLWRITAADGSWHGKYRTAQQASHLAILASPMFDGDAPPQVHLTPAEWSAMVAREVEEGAR